MDKSLDLKTGSINVRDFGAVPDDGKCDAQAIRSAIEHARENNIAEVVFEAGRYDLKIGSDIEVASKKAYVALNNFTGGLTLKGQTDEEGTPITLLIRENPCKSGEFEELPSIILVDKSEGITMENLRFDNDPFGLSVECLWHMYNFMNIK